VEVFGSGLLNIWISLRGHEKTNATPSQLVDEPQ